MHRPPLRARLFAALLLAAPAPAGAHARLVASSPAAGAVVATAPVGIDLEFNEPVEAKLSRIDVFDAGGARWPVGSPSIDAGNAAKLIVPIVRRLQPGSYQVEWQAVSKDMHKVTGRFGFRIGP
jgi:methionine-rich copper-binding protein CopC